MSPGTREIESKITPSVLDTGFTIPTTIAKKCAVSGMAVVGKSQPLNPNDGTLFARGASENVASPKLLLGISTQVPFNVAGFPVDDNVATKEAFAPILGKLLPVHIHSDIVLTNEELEVVAETFTDNLPVPPISSSLVCAWSRY